MRGNFVVTTHLRYASRFIAVTTCRVFVQQHIRSQHKDGDYTVYVYVYGICALGLFLKVLYELYSTIRKQNAKYLPLFNFINCRHHNIFVTIVRSREQDCIGNQGIHLGITKFCRLTLRHFSVATTLYQ